MEEIIKQIKVLKMDQPDTSRWSYDTGWNGAIDKVLQILEPVQHNVRWTGYQPRNRSDSELHPPSGGSNVSKNSRR